MRDNGVVSVPPPGAKPPTAAAAPTDANAGRSDRFREITHSTWFVYAIVLAPLAGAGIGLAIGALAFAALGVVVAGAVVVGVAFWIADSRAEGDFFALYATYRGMTQQSIKAVAPITPLLSKGDRNHYEHYMSGPVSKQVASPQCVLAHYTYVTVERNTDSSGHTSSSDAKHPFTVCVVAVEQTVGFYHAIDLIESAGGIFGSIAGKVGDLFDGKRTRQVELESAELTDRFHLKVSSQIDEVRVRELFSPQFIVWLTQNFDGMNFELRGGQLVVYVKGHLEDSASLDRLLDGSDVVAARMLEEIAEEPPGRVHQ